MKQAEQPKKVKYNYGCVLMLFLLAGGLIWGVVYLVTPAKKEPAKPISKEMKAKVDSMAVKDMSIDTPYHIYNLINKSPEQIAEILGKPNRINPHPTDCGDVKYCDYEAFYKHDSIDIVFSGKRAKWFEFDGLERFKWEDKHHIFSLERCDAFIDEFNYAWYHCYPFS